MKNRLSFKVKFAYGVPAFALAVVGVPVFIFLPKFYSDTLGVPVSMIGYIILAARIMDAVSDPLFGYASDRTQSRFGRRRPYIAVGAAALSMNIIMLFNPPAQSSPLFNTLWFGSGLLLLSLSWTAVMVPYESLGPELTGDHHERTGLFALRDGFTIAGTMAAAASPALISWLFSLTSAPDDRHRLFFWISVVYTPLVAGTCGWCCAVIREKKQPRDIPDAVFLKRTHPVKDALKAVQENRPFRILLGAFTLSAIGSNMPATLILYYVEYVLHSARAELFLMLYLITGVLFLPLWISASQRFGKKRAWITAMAVNSGVFLGVYFLGPGDEMIYGVLVCLSGIGFGGALALPSSIQADVIDYDELLSGERREGRYIGLWSISKKAASGLGIGIALLVIGGSGYTPNIRQSPEVIHALKVLYALIPSICHLIAVVIALSYPIDEGLHREIRLNIRKRKAGNDFCDPLTQKSIGENYHERDLKCMDCPD